jgi:hypothetical protein
MDGERPPQMQRNSGGNPSPAEREPTEAEADAFARLFGDAYRKCFSAAFAAPLTEAESHRLSVEIAESTGLEIGWKSLKNYSQFLLGQSSRAENPSLPTLDTLARYVVGAPRTDEARRRSRERHYPYWVRYREALRPPDADPTPESRTERMQPAPPIARDATMRPAPGRPIVLVAVAALVLALLVVIGRWRGARGEQFTDEFDDVSAAGLAARGWSAQRVDSAHWTRRAERPGHLTLFTLQGDNWPHAGQAPGIADLLVRPVPADCFLVDVRFTSFVPSANWQQAGLLLLEDTAFAGRSVRMSIGYNDFSGGFPKTREIIVQAITSLGRASDKPEEIVHHRLFLVDSAEAPLVRQNLQSSALRIEKRGGRLRLLASAASMRNAAFKEVGATEFDFQPKYVAVFAMKGYVPESAVVPVHVDAFGQSACR